MCDVKKLVEKIELSLSKLNHYIESELNNDLLQPKQKDLACYYKLPMFLFETGQINQAKKVLDFIYDQFLMTDGDFKTNEGLKSAKPEYVEYWSYFNGWILRASNLLEYPLPGSALSFFQSLYLGQGMFCSQRQENISGGNTDVLTVAHHGLFYLETSATEWSENAIHFLKYAIDNQPEINNRFFLRFDQNKQAITKFSHEQQLLFTVEKNQGANQLYFMMAYPCAFLGLYYRSTGDAQALETAKQYMDFILSCDEAIYSSRFSHKTAWAASILYAETGDRKYLEVVEKITDYFISIQSDGGTWFHEEGEAVYLDQSAEIGCWFSLILKNVQLYENKLTTNNYQQRLFGNGNAVCPPDNKTESKSAGSNLIS